MLVKLLDEYCCFVQGIAPTFRPQPGHVSAGVDGVIFKEDLSFCEGSWGLSDYIR